MRGVLNSVLIGLLTVVYGVTACLTWPFDRSGDTVIRVARAWGRAVCRCTGMRIEVESAGPLDPARPYVFMANHLSAADIWALFAVLPVPVRMIAKMQLGRIPFLGWAMHAGRFIFIDRQNATAARRSIDRAAARIREGCSVLLFPEGTRSRDGRLKPFKKGGFHLAAQAGVPIVPVAVQGTYELARPDSLQVRPGRVKVTIGAPIETAGLELKERLPLMVKVRTEVAQMLGEDAGPEHVAPSRPGSSLPAEAGDPTRTPG